MRHGQGYYVPVPNSLRRGNFTQLQFLECHSSPHSNAAEHAAVATRLNKGGCDKNPASDFHRRYCGIVSSLGYLVAMTRQDLSWAYSELSQYVQFPGNNHMLAAQHVLSSYVIHGIKQFVALVTLTKAQTFCGSGWMRIGPEILTPSDLARDTLS